MRQEDSRKKICALSVCYKFFDLIASFQHCINFLNKFYLKFKLENFFFRFENRLTELYF